MSYFNSLSQNAKIVASNSSTANLGPGATFTGAAADTLNVNAIQITFHADQNCTVYVDQSTDGTNWDTTDQFAYNVLKNNLGQTVTAVAAFFRTRVTNLSSTTATTTFRLQSILCPIAEPLPRALDQLGHLLVNLNGLHDHFGFEGEFTPMRDMKIVEPVRLVGTTFASAIDTNFWTATNTGAASASGVANAIATISSGTANNGFGKLQSVRVARFQFAHPLLWRGAVRLNATTVAQNTAYWGPFSESSQAPQNGPYFSVSPTGVLSLNMASGGSVTSIASGSFNGDVSELATDTNVHAYEIVYFTMGAWFYVDNVLLHKFTPTTAVLYQSLETPITIMSVNSGSGTTNRTIECWNASIIKWGRHLTAPASKTQVGTTAGVTWKSGPGIVHAIAISGITTGSTVTLYDNTAASGTVLWTSGSQTIASQSNNLPYSIPMELPFYTGLTLVISGAAANATISYE